MQIWRFSVSKIEDLINQLCPDGVEHKQLGDVAEFNRGKALSRSEMNDGQYPVVAGGIKPVSWCDKFNRTGESVSVSASGANAGYINYWNEPIFVTDAFTIDVDQTDVLPKYLYYVLSNKQDYIHSLKRGGGVPHVYGRMIANLEIPVPPLPVQQEIVDILDKFTALQTALQTELDLRKQQYEYYRDQLLSQQYLTTLCPNGVEYKRLGDMVSYEQPTKYLVASKDYSDEFSVPVLTAGKTFILGYTAETNGIYQAIKDNPVIIFDDFTTEFKWVDFPFKAKSSGMKMLTVDSSAPVLLRYIYYAMHVITYIPLDHKRHWISEYSNFKIPVPPLPVQQEIVDILDEFSAMTTSLTDGLPAEIALRQKQYEYYRDKLLAFKEKVQ